MKNNINGETERFYLTTGLVVHLSFFQTFITVCGSPQVHFFLAHLHSSGAAGRRPGVTN